MAYAFAGSNPAPPNCEWRNEKRLFGTRGK
jgi:hypothetical protein